MVFIGGKNVVNKSGTEIICCQIMALKQGLKLKFLWGPNEGLSSNPK